LGMLARFDELGIKCSVISGSSAGAIVGAFYAHGYAPREILNIIVKSKIYHVIRPAIGKSGFLKLNVTEKLLLKYFPENSFEKLNMPLYVTATDVTEGRTVYFSEGALIRPLIASASIPVIFHPVQIGGVKYIDGGILNNLPVEPLIGKCDRIIGVNCNPLGKKVSLSMRELLQRSMLMAVNNVTYRKKHYCDLFLEPSGLADYSVFDFSREKKIFDIGYNHILGKEPQIMKLLNSQ